MGLWLKQLPIRYFFRRTGHSPAILLENVDCLTPPGSVFLVAIGNLHQVLVDSHKTLEEFHHGDFHCHLWRGSKKLTQQKGEKTA